jgi:hypothetical protein
MKHDNNRVLQRSGARELTPEETAAAAGYGTTLTARFSGPPARPTDVLEDAPDAGA